MTDEGEQLQAGLASHGWTLAGYGYGDGCTDVPALLVRHKPSILFVQDKRDWDRNNPGGSFGNRRLHFDRINVLAQREDIFRVGVCKDAGSMQDYQAAAAAEIDADALVIYYHPKSVLEHGPWLRGYQLIRTYHSIDARHCAAFPLDRPRLRGLVSGACGPVYPLRTRAAQNAEALRIDVLPHPGYGAAGCWVGDYLQILSHYRVSVATASRYGFALRKIIESVAMGCTPVTDLPAYDVLPEIDKALVRVPANCSLDILRAAIDQADRSWNIERAQYFADCARRFYDYRYLGRKLDAAIIAAAEHIHV
jgi:hypothetical protein